MSDASTEVSSRQGPEEEVAIGTYVFVLLAWWREIVIGTALCAIGGGVLIMAMQVLQPKYEASAHVVIVRTTADVSIDDKLTIRSSTPPNFRHHVAARRAALVGLVRNGNVAQAVIERLRGQLLEVNTAILLGGIDAELVTVGPFTEQNSSDLIRIVASADSPEKAEVIANVWAEEYVNHVNLLYEQVPLSLVSSINDEIKSTEAAYKEVQEELKVFIAESRVDELGRQIAAKQAVVSQWSRALEEMLEQSHGLRRKLLWLLETAHDFRLQVERAGDAGVASNSLALLAIKAEAYASLAELPGTLEIRYDIADVTHTNATDQGADVDALILTLQDRLAQLTSLIMRQSVELAERHGRYGTSMVEDNDTIVKVRIAEGGDEPSLPPSGKSYLSAPQDQFNDSEETFRFLIIDLEEDIRKLKSEKDLADTVLLDLIEKRNILRSALKTLQNESVELLLKKAGSVSEVRLASRAMMPVASAYPSKHLAAVMGGIAGLLATVCFVFLANSTGTRPLLEKWRRA